MKKREQKKGAEAPTSTPQVEQRSPTPEEQAQMQIKAQRARTEVAVLKQRFAEVDVAKTIAESERDQLVQRLQMAQQIIERLTKELGEARVSSGEQDAAKDEEPEAAAKDEEPEAE